MTKIFWITSTYVKEFSADAVLVYRKTKTFTVDALLQVQGTGKTFTADALVKKTQTKTFTADAFVQKTQSKTFTCDAIVKKTQSKTFTLDSLVKQTQSKTFTSDAIVKKTQTKSFSLDAILVKVKTKTATADSLLQKTYSKTFTADAALATARLRSKVGQFQITAGTGTLAITDVGFTPKALILWTTYQTATGITDGAKFAIGWTDGSHHRTESVQSTDNAATSDTERMVGNVLLRVVTDGAGTEGLRLTFTSFDSGGFTVNKSTNASGTNVYINYFALGGTDITANAGQFSMNTSTGNQSVTTPGFQPDILFLAGDGGTSTGTGNSNGGTMFLGMAKSSSKRGVININSENGRATMATERMLNSNQCIIITTSTGTIDALADFVSMDSTGFTVNISDAPTNASNVHYLAIKGGLWDVGKFAITSGTSNQSVTGGTFQPHGVLLFSDQSATDNPAAMESHCHLAVGAATSTTDKVATNYADENGTADSETANSMVTTGVLRFLQTNVAATGSSTGIDLDADLVSFEPGGFTLSKGTNTNTQLGQVLYVTYGALRTFPKTFTTDALIQKTQSKTFTTDAILQKTQNKTLTADAVLVNRRTKTFAADAMVRKTQSKTFSADVLVKKTQSKTFTSDALLKQTLTKSFACDSLLRKTQSKSFSTDALLRKTFTKTLTADAVLKATSTKTFTADALLQKRQTKSFAIDALLLQTGSKTFSLDAVLKKTQSKSAELDALLQQTQTKSFIVDATLLAAGTKTFTIDAVLQQTQTKTFTIDSILFAGVAPQTRTKTFSIDAFLAAAGQAQGHYGDNYGNNYDVSQPLPGAGGRRKTPKQVYKKRPLFTIAQTDAPRKYVPSKDPRRKRVKLTIGGVAISAIIAPDDYENLYARAKVSLSPADILGEARARLESKSESNITIAAKTLVYHDRRRKIESTSGGAFALLMAQSTGQVCGTIAAKHVASAISGIATGHWGFSAISKLWSEHYNWTIESRIATVTTATSEARLVSEHTGHLIESRLQISPESQAKAVLEWLVSYNAFANIDYQSYRNELLAKLALLAEMAEFDE